MNVKNIEDILNPYLEKNGFKLYDIGFVRESGMNILRVLVNKKGGINIDELSEINNYLSDELDKLDIPYDEYMLEVSSPGAEMALRNPEEVMEHVGEYININTGDKVYEGVMVSFIDNVVVIRVNLKGRFKNFEIPYDSIKKIRLAVKF
jgi:ribosome maturation factor RimP